MNKPTRLRSRASNITAAPLSGDDPGPRPPRGSGSKSSLVHMMELTGMYQALRREKERLKEQFDEPVKIRLDTLAPSPFRVGGIDEERVEALVANLRSNPLNSPIVVRVVDGQLEIIAGHYRVEAFRRLGREEIDAVYSSVEDDVARALVFFDSPVSPSLSDIVAYEGFKRKS